MPRKRIDFAVAILTLLFACPPSMAQDQGFATVESLGEALFFDSNLSVDRTMSCSWCHAPGRAFIDQLQPGEDQALPTGPDGKPIGIRNTPTAMYSKFTPAFEKVRDGRWRGGLFLDGRASTLEEQARGPLLNPQEMAMPDKASVVARLMENKDYVKAFKKFYGQESLEKVENSFQALTSALATYERTSVFAPFDSRYDRFLRGEVTLSEQEEFGRKLFFSEEATTCSQCHILHKNTASLEETFTDYAFFNVGIPGNKNVQSSQSTTDIVDIGLQDNDLTPHTPELRGQFRTPTLRNVAVTAPYMHNGVFKDLRTVVAFFNSYNSKTPSAQINGETGKTWERPEVGETVSRRELQGGKALDEVEIDALVAFLKTLTDRRYGNLIK